MTLVPRNNNLGVSLFDNMFDDFFKDPFFTRNNAVKVMKTDIQEKDNKSVFKYTKDNGYILATDWLHH